MNLKKYVLRPLKPLFLLLYGVAFFLAQTLLRIVYPVRAIGRDNLPAGGYVLAPNHIKAIDPLYVLMARGFARKMLVMGKDELFHKGALLNFLWAVFGAFPIDRGAGDRAVIDTVMEQVHKGRGLLIFPEGTRTKDGNLGRLKSGAFVIAMEANAPMVPCRIHYRAGGPKPFRRITVIFGAPLTPAQMGLEGDYNAKKLRGAKHLFAQQLEELYEQNKDRL